MGKLDSNKAGIIFFGAVITLFVFQMIILSINIEETVRTWIFSFGAQIVFGGVFIVGCILYRVNIPEVTGIKRGLSFLQIVFVIIIATLCIAAFLPIANFVLKLLRFIGYTYTPVYGDYVSTNALFVLGLFGLAVFPAIGEELLFRANMVSGFKGKGYIFAIVMSAFMFALMHGNPTQLVHQFLIGAVMAYLFLITRSFFAPAIFHFINNFIAITINLLQARTAFGSQIADFLAMNSKGSIIGMIIMSISGIVLLVVALVGFTRLTIKIRERKEKIQYKEVVVGLDKKVSLNAFFLYFDRDYSKAISIKDEKDKLSAGFFAGLGLILLIWLLNLFAG